MRWDAQGRAGGEFLPLTSLRILCNWSEASLTGNSSSREMETICNFGLRPDLTRTGIFSTKCLDFSS